MTPAPLTRILLVEDDPDIQAVARLALEKRGGFTVAVCSRGREAIEHAPSFRPDLIVLDVMMPDMDGPQTLQALREIGEVATIPIVFMTARVHHHDTVRYMNAGAVAVIKKPFDPLRLPDTLNTIWEHYCVRSEYVSATDGDLTQDLCGSAARQGSRDRGPVDVAV